MRDRWPELADDIKHSPETAAFIGEVIAAFGEIEIVPPGRKYKSPDTFEETFSARKRWSKRSFAGGKRLAVQPGEAEV